LQFHLLVTLIPTPYPKPAVENGFSAVFPSFSFWGLHGTEQSQVQAVPEIYVFFRGGQQKEQTYCITYAK